MTVAKVTQPARGARRSGSRGCLCPSQPSASRLHCHCLPKDTSIWPGFTWRGRILSSEALSRLQDTCHQHFALCPDCAPVRAVSHTCCRTRGWAAGDTARMMLAPLVGSRGLLRIPALSRGCRTSTSGFLARAQLRSQSALDYSQVCYLLMYDLVKAASPL